MNTPDLEDNVIDLIKFNKPYFQKEKFIKMAKENFTSLFRLLNTANYKQVKDICSDELAKRLIDRKEQLLELNEENDFISVQNGRIRNYKMNEEFEEIDVELYTFYIDYMKNNKIKYDPHKKRYSNHIYMVTFQIPLSYTKNIDNNICPQCSGRLKKDLIKNIYECDYCHYKKNLDIYNDWKISDIKEI